MKMFEIWSLPTVVFHTSRLAKEFHSHIRHRVWTIDCKFDKHILKYFSYEYSLSLLFLQNAICM